MNSRRRHVSNSSAYYAALLCKLVIVTVCLIFFCHNLPIISCAKSHHLHYRGAPGAPGAMIIACSSTSPCYQYGTHRINKDWIAVPSSSRNNGYGGVPGSSNTNFSQSASASASVGMVNFVPPVQGYHGSNIMGLLPYYGQQKGRFHPRAAPRTNPGAGKKKQKSPPYQQHPQQGYGWHGGWKHQVEEVEEPCDGYENFVLHVEIASLLLGILALAKALFALLLHVINQAYLALSTYGVGFPERLAIVINLIQADTIPANVEEFLTVLGILDYLILAFGSWPVGQWIVYISGISQILTVITLATAAFTVFSEMIKDKLKHFGIDLEEIFEGYGCGKEEKFMQILEGINDFMS